MESVKKFWIGSGLQNFHIRTSLVVVVLVTTYALSCICTRDDHGVGVLEWTPAGAWIFVRSRSQYFKFEQESELESKFRSVQEPIKCFKGPIKIYVMKLGVLKLNGINDIKYFIITN